VILEGVLEKEAEAYHYLYLLGEEAVLVVHYSLGEELEDHFHSFLLEEASKFEWEQVVQE